jgi:hypothetical protein
MLRPSLLPLLPALLCALVLFPAASGCTESDGDDGGGSAGSGDGDGDGDAGMTDDALYAIAVWTTDPGGAWVGNLLVTDDLSSSGAVDLAKAISFEDDMVYASPGNGQIFVGPGERPVIERYSLNDDDELVLDDEMGLDQYGIATGMGSKEPLHFISDTKAYFIDEETLQLVIFDPTAMETEDVVSLEDFEHETYPWVSLNFVYRDGDRLLLSARYWRDDDTAAPLVRVAIIDSTDDSVTFIDDTRCGNITFHAHDSMGNLYLASHPAQTAAVAAGTAGDPAVESCIVRINSGADEFDDGYYVDLDELAEASAAGVIQGPNDEAFVMVYAGDPITAENVNAVPKGSYWELHSVTLGDEEDTFTKVDGIGLQSGYGMGFTLEVDGTGVPYVISVKDDFSEGAYWNASDASELELGLTVPGWPGSALKLR